MHLMGIILALIVVESNGNNNAVGDNGNAVGCLQIHKVFVDDVNRILGRKEFTYQDRKSKDKSIKMALVYLKYYGDVYQKKTGKKPTVDVLVRIFNGGPEGYKKQATKEYAGKFLRVYSTTQVAIK